MKLRKRKTKYSHYKVPLMFIILITVVCTIILIKEAIEYTIVIQNYPDMTNIKAYLSSLSIIVNSKFKHYIN